MHYNNTYKKALDKLQDGRIFDQCLSEFYKKLESEYSMTYYTIGINHDKTGIFGYINNYLPHIVYAITQGYIPVIDMKNYPSIYQKDEENAWEKFYLQPCGKSLHDIQNHKVLHVPHDLWYRWPQTHVL